MDITRRLQKLTRSRVTRRHEYQEMNEIELTELHSTVGENQCIPIIRDRMAKYQNLC